MIQIKVLNSDYSTEIQILAGQIIRNFYLLQSEPIAASAQMIHSKNDISWIILSSAAGRVAIGVQKKATRLINFRSLLNYISSVFNAEFCIESGLFHPAEFGRFKASAFSLPDKQQVLLCLSDNLKVANLKSPSNLNHIISLTLFAENNQPGSEYVVTYYADFKFKFRIMNFELVKRRIMENIMISAGLRIGKLQLSIDEFLSLKPGSQISFELPHSAEIQLEVGENVFASGNMSAGSDGTVIIRLNEICSQTDTFNDR